MFLSTVALFLLKGETVIRIFSSFEERGLGFFLLLPPHIDYAERGPAGHPSKDASASSFAMIAGTTVPLAPR